MVLESAQKSDKKGRGRPRKYPVEQTGTTRKDLQDAVVRGISAPTRTEVSHVPAARSTVSHTKTTHTATQSPLKKTKSSSSDAMTREDELAAFERHSNKSGVLTLFVLLLGVALIGYGMYNKLSQSETSSSVPTTQTTSLKSTLSTL
jgi:hypothetical protein